MSERLDPQMAAMLARSAGRAAAWAAPLDEARAGLRPLREAVHEARRLYDDEARALVTRVPGLVDVREVELAPGSTRARWYRPTTAIARPVVLFLHGGSWMFGSVDSHDNLCRHLAERSSCCVLSLGYRLSPEAPFPAGLEDASRAVDWVRAHGVGLGCDPERFALAGDSAGANIAAAAVLRGASPQGLLMLYPSVDARMGSRSWEELGDGYRLTREDTRWYYDQYVPAPVSQAQPLVSPLLADDLTSFPATFVQTAELDPLRDEAESFAARLQAAGVDAETRRYPGVIHGFMRFEELDAAQEAIDDAARWLRSHL